MKNKKELKGLVLAGGKSQRMGTDKGDLVYHILPQKYHTAELLENLGLEAFISLRDTQGQEKGYQYIFDKKDDIGLISGLLSAFEEFETSWLCVGCDYPLLQKNQLQKLVDERDSSKMATVFKDENSGFLIPTLAIYEVGFYPILKHNMELGNFSLQRILNEISIKEIGISGANYKSIDTKIEYERIRGQLD